MNSIHDQHDVAHDVSGEARSWYRRAATTPFRDFVRGQVTGRMDVAWHLAQAKLPSEAQTIVRETVRRSKVWRIERVDVARELIAHFRDGLEAGKLVDQLVRDFGDVRKASKLIRAGVRRKRPMVWWVWMRSLQMAGAVVGCAVMAYVVLAIRYFSGEPKINHNYLNELNQKVVSSPMEQRGWPLYRTALLAIKRDTKAHPELTTYTSATTEQEMLLRRQAQLQRLRDIVPVLQDAASRPTLGYDLEAPIDAEIWSGAIPTTAEKNPPLIEVLLPYLGDLRMMARFMATDVRVGMEERDPARVVKGLQTVFGMARQTRNEPFLIGQFVSISILDLGCALTKEVIAQAPGLLSDENLRTISASIHETAPGDRVRVTLDAERISFDDTLQRMFTDDGHGDGWLTPAGLQLMLQAVSVDQLLPLVQTSPPKASQVIAPLGAALHAGRRATKERFEQVLAEYERWNDIPLWKWEGPTVESTLDPAGLSMRERMRFALVGMLVPSLGRSYVVGEQATQTRDATQLVIAMERFRIKSGHWPSTLSELVPGFLPALPIDRLDGTPLKYRLNGDRPLVYSVGVDRRDDGGRPIRGGADNGPIYNQGWRTATEARKLLESLGPRANALDGDVILWPDPSLPGANTN